MTNRPCLRDLRVSKYADRILHSVIINNTKNFPFFVSSKWLNSISRFQQTHLSHSPQDPASAIPKGTLLALLISMVSYAVMVLFAGAGALRDASGNLTDLVMANGTVVDYSGVSACAVTGTCQFGLHNSYSVRPLYSL